MASTSNELFEAIDAGDVGRVDAILDDDPAAASSRDASGVSALMRALYRFDKALTESVRRRVDILDVFEASGFGDVDRLTAAPQRRALVGELPTPATGSRRCTSPPSSAGPRRRRSSSIEVPRSTPSAAGG